MLSSRSRRSGEFRKIGWFCEVAARSGFCGFCGRAAISQNFNCYARGCAQIRLAARCRLLAALALWSFAVPPSRRRSAVLVVRRGAARLRPLRLAAAAGSLRFCVCAHACRALRGSLRSVVRLRRDHKHGVPRRATPCHAVAQRATSSLAALPTRPAFLHLPGFVCHTSKTAYNSTLACDKSRVLQNFFVRPLTLPPEKFLKPPP